MASEKTGIDKHAWSQFGEGNYSGWREDNDDGSNDGERLRAYTLHSTSQTWTRSFAEPCGQQKAIQPWGSFGGFVRVVRQYIRPGKPKKAVDGTVQHCCRLFARLTAVSKSWNKGRRAECRVYHRAMAFNTGSSWLKYRKRSSSSRIEPTRDLLTQPDVGMHAWKSKQTCLRTAWWDIRRNCWRLPLAGRCSGVSGIPSRAVPGQGL